MMGGQIWVESEVGEVSKFQFNAQFGLQDDPVATQQRPLPELAGLRVLVVDDNATNRRILQVMVSGWGLEPALVESGPAALVQMRRAAAHGEPFHLVLLDAMMPEMDGFAMAGQVDQEPELEGALIMMLTSGDRQGDSTRCRELGINAHLTKPIKQADLMDAVLTAVRERPPIKDIARAEALTPHPLSGHALHVLVAEDNTVNQRLVVGLLSKRGHKVEVAGNGKEALLALERAQFDVVLMDLQMPEMGGFEATAVIRENEKTTGKHVPIVALTAHAMAEDRERCLVAGMDEYVSKPNDSENLFRVLENLTPATPDADADIGEGGGGVRS